MKNMKKLELWDAHFALKFPERHAEQSETIRNAFRQVIIERGYDPDDPEAIAAIRDQQAIEHYKTFDLSILDELCLTLDDVLSLTEEKQKRIRAGSKRSEIKEKAPLNFLQIVIESECDGYDFSRTLNRIDKRLSKDSTTKLDKRTYRSWLTDLSKSPWCDIPPPRGKTK